MQEDKSLLKAPNSRPLVSIGVDLMGSDRPPHVLFDAVLQAAKKLGSGLELLAFISPEAWELLSDKQKHFDDPSCARIAFQFADEVIEMSDDPLSAIRHKKNSSLILGLRQLKKKTIDGFVSLGNTGALIAAATITLPLLPGIRRPALLATLPAKLGRVSILDVGGSLSSKSGYLTRFALMGTCFQKIHFGINDPLVGLLNVGAESKKGTEEHRLTYQTLQKDPSINFIGNLEGFEVFQGKAHVVVTDGFTGNVLLKSAEGIASYILDYLKETQTLEHVKQLEKRFSSDEHPGAILLGVEGVVVKCHGGSSPTALFNGIKAAYSYVQKELIEKLKADLTKSK